MKKQWFRFDLWPRKAGGQFVDQVFAGDEQEALHLFDARHPGFRHETIGISWPLLEPLKPHECGWQPKNAQTIGS